MHKDSVAPSEKLEASGNLGDIEAPKDSALKRMAMEQGLYEQVFMIRQRDLDNKKEKENTKKYNFQNQYEISKRWFDLDYECSEESFITIETNFYFLLSNEY